MVISDKLAVLEREIRALNMRLTVERDGNFWSMRLCEMCEGKEVRCDRLVTTEETLEDALGGLSLLIAELEDIERWSGGADCESVWPQFLAEIFARVSKRIDNAIRKHEAEYHKAEEVKPDDQH